MDKKVLLKRIVTNVPVPKGPGAYMIQDDSVRYVGSTKNLVQRKCAHNTRLQNNRHENRLLQEHSNNSGPLKFIPIPTTTIEEALIIEQKLLDENFNNGLLTNAQPSASSPKGRVVNSQAVEKMRQTSTGRSLTEEHKKNIGAGHTGLKYNRTYKHTPEHCEKISKSLKGHVTSKETKQKLSAFHTGKKWALGNVLTQETRDKMSESKGTKVLVDGVVYNSYNDAAKKLNVSPQTVLNRCKSEKQLNWQIYGPQSSSH